MASWLERAANPQLERADVAAQAYTDFLTRLAPQLDPAKNPARGTADILYGGLSGGPIDQVLDASTLRNWVLTNPFVYSAIQLRRAQVATSRWAILPNDPESVTNPKLNAMLIDAITLLLSEPNPTGKNNAFSSLIEPVIDDILTLGVGAIVPTRNGKGLPLVLEHVDASRIGIIDGWDGDGPRYTYLLDDDHTYLMLTNDDLITIVGNPVTYSEVGLAPLRVLHRILRAEYDTFMSVHALQKNRAPSGLVNFQGMDDEHLRRMRMMFKNELSGNSTIGMINYPIQDLQYLQFGSANLMEQGVDWFYETMIRAVCAAFQVAPTALQWGDPSKASATVQMSLTLDQGVIPLMKLIAGYINREIVAPFGDSNLAFVWLDLVETEEPEDIQTLELQTHGRTIVSINDLRIRGGYDTEDVKEYPNLTPETEPIVDEMLNKPGWTVGGNLYPLSVAAQLLLTDMHQAVRAAEQAQNPPEPIPPELLNAVGTRAPAALPDGAKTPETASGAPDTTPDDTAPATEPPAAAKRATKDAADDDMETGVATLAAAFATLFDDQFARVS